MSRKVEIKSELRLEYWTGDEEPGGPFRNFPVEPDYTSELVMAVRPDQTEDEIVDSGVPEKLQIHLAGSARALEALGRYLIALARLQTADKDVHEHFEDVNNDDGGTVHLIVRRLSE